MSDHAARTATEYHNPVPVELCTSITANNLASINDVSLLQETADVLEHKAWRSHGYKYVNILWVHNDGRVVGPGHTCLSHAFTCEQQGGCVEQC